MSEGFQGNKNVKAGGTKTSYTREQIVEYAKCAEDPCYFIENYVKVISLDAGVVPFKLRPYQRRIVETVHDNRFTIAMLFRQSGKSTIMAAYCLWFITFNDHKTAAILANKKAQAIEIFSRMQYMYELLPDWLKQGMIEWNKTSCTLENGSKCFCAASSASSIRGRSINLLLLDEFAFLQSGIAEDFIASVFPTLTSSRESKLVLVSTPNGLNQFYRIWKDSENGKNDFVRVRGYWNEIYDQKWYEQQCRLLNNDSAKIASELDCQFLGSAQTLIDSNKIQCLVAETPIFDKNNLRVFEPPQKEHAYYLTVDVSRGRGLDYSAIIVFDVTTMPFKVVATFKDNTISPMELPTLIYNLGMQYNESLVMIEANDLGESVANELWWTLEYPGVLHTKDGKIGGSGILGVKTTKGVKNRGCSKFKELIENDQLIVNDGRIIEELEGYVLGKKGSYEAQNTKINDDLCACLFLFGWSCESDYFRDYANNDVSRTLIDRYKAEVEETIPAMGTFTDGGDDPYENFRLNQEQMDMLR